MIKPHDKKGQRNSLYNKEYTRNSKTYILKRNAIVNLTIHAFSAFDSDI